MGSGDDAKLQSDRSWLSMTVDAMVGRPELFSRVLEQGREAEKAPEVREALRIIADKLATVEWAANLPEQQMLRLVALTEQLTSEAQKAQTVPAQLAAKTFRWAVQNRKWGRARPTVHDGISEVDFDELGAVGP